MAGHSNPSNPTRHRHRWHRASTCETQPSALQDNPFLKTLQTQIVLEHVLGMTVYSNSALASDPRSGVVAYPAGCVLVLLDSVKNKQLGTLKAPRKSITAVSFSCDGRFVLTGESGLQPAVRVWSMTSMTEVAVLRGHSFGIKSVVFSPRMREIIVVGDAQDMMISVWSWPGKVMHSLNKFSDEIFTMDVSTNSQYFVTVGNKHVKFYYLETKRWHGGPEPTCPIPLTCRYGMLDNLKENCFCDVICGQGDNCYVFVITTSGILCQINSNRFLERWVNVNLSRASSLSCDAHHVFVGGCQGVIRMFDACNLQIVLTLPRPHCLGLDISQVISTDNQNTEPPFDLNDHRPDTPSTEDPKPTAEAEGASPNNNAAKGNNYTDTDIDPNGRSTRGHPGVVALTFDTRLQNLTVVYEDHSLYIWRRLDLRDGGFQFQKRYSSMYHRGGVWDLTTYPMTPAALPGQQTDSLADAMIWEQEVGGAFPPGSLLSVSADGTLRVWDVSADICQESLLKRNSVSPQCLKIVYGERQEQTNQKKPPGANQKKSPDANHKKSPDANQKKPPDANQKKTVHANQRKPPDTPARRSAKPSDGLPGLAVSRHKKQGFTVVSVCPAGVHIATGNRHGRVSIYDTNTMKVKVTMHAHEAEVTALAYSITHNYKVLASGSRDRMIHVMDASRGYHLLTTLDDHSSTITAINFTYISHYMIMATSSLDMSVLVRVYMGSESFILNPVRAIVEKKSITDFAIHPWSGSLAFACQDRLVRVYSIMTSTDHHSFRGCPSYGGQLVKVQFDPSGQYLLTACSSKTINLLQYTSGTLLSTFSGHAESITSIRFSHNVKHVISAAVDGCIFLWRLPESVTYAVKKEMAEMGRLTRAMVFKRTWKKCDTETNKQLKPTASEPAISSASEAHSRQPARPSQPQSVGAADTKHPTVDTAPCGDGDGGLARHQNQLLKQETTVSRYQTETQGVAIDNKAKTDPFLTLQKIGRSRSSDWHEDNVITERQNEGDLQPHASGQDASKKRRFDNVNPKNVDSAREDFDFDLDQSSVKPNPWLTACCERRRIFKLEARSIKKIIGMMRLVTDAMEKDLANADNLISSSPCPPPCLLQARPHSSCDNVPAPQSQGKHTRTTVTDIAHKACNSLGSRSLHQLKQKNPNSCQDETVCFCQADVEARHPGSCCPKEDYEMGRDQELYPGSAQAEPETVLDMRSSHTASQLEKLLREPRNRGRFNTDKLSPERRPKIQALCIDGTSNRMGECIDGEIDGELDAAAEGHSTNKETDIQLIRNSQDLPNSLYNYSTNFHDTSSVHRFAGIRDLNFTTSNGYCSPCDWEDQGTWFGDSSDSFFPCNSAVNKRPGFLLLSTEPMVMGALEKLQALMSRARVETIHLGREGEIVLETDFSEIRNTLVNTGEPGNDILMKNRVDDKSLVIDDNINVDGCDSRNDCALLGFGIKTAEGDTDWSDSDTASCEDLNDWDALQEEKEMVRKVEETKKNKMKECSDLPIDRTQDCEGFIPAGVSSFVVDYQPVWSLRHGCCQSQIMHMKSSILLNAEQCKSDTELIRRPDKSETTAGYVSYNKLTCFGPNPTALSSSPSSAVRSEHVITFVEEKSLSETDHNIANFHGDEDNTDKNDTPRVSYSNGEIIPLETQLITAENETRESDRNPDSVFEIPVVEDVITSHQMDSHSGGQREILGSTCKTKTSVEEIHSEGHILVEVHMHSDTYSCPQEDKNAHESGLCPLNVTKSVSLENKIAAREENEAQENIGDVTAQAIIGEGHLTPEVSPSIKETSANQEGGSNVVTLGEQCMADCEGINKLQRTTTTLETVENCIRMQIEKYINYDPENEAESDNVCNDECCDDNDVETIINDNNNVNLDILDYKNDMVNEELNEK